MLIHIFFGSPFLCVYHVFIHVLCFLSHTMFEFLAYLGTSERTTEVFDMRACLVLQGCTLMNHNSGIGMVGSEMFQQVDEGENRFAKTRDKYEPYDP